MPYYFMRDTPLQALEQLMMFQPGQKPRGGGIYRSPFHYTPKDVACEYCQNYVRKHPCRLCECTCLDERIEAGVLELNEFVRDCFAPSNSISLEVLSEEAIAVVSIEDEYMEQISADEAAVLVRLLRQGLSSHLTETQRRRLWKYCVESKPVRLIAKEECAYRNAVWKSIQAAKEKMFKFFVETGCAKPRFRRDR